MFYTGMAIAFVVLAGFARTYYLRPQFFKERLPFYLHVHSAGFSAWIALLVAQTALVAIGRTPLHRVVGWAALA